MLIKLTLCLLFYTLKNPHIGWTYSTNILSYYDCVGNVQYKERRRLAESHWGVPGKLQGLLFVEFSDWWLCEAREKGWMGASENLKLNT